VTEKLRNGRVFDAQFVYSKSSLLGKPDILSEVRISIGSHTESMPRAAFSDLPEIDASHAPLVTEIKNAPELTVWTVSAPSQVHRVSWIFQNDSLSERRLYTPHGSEHAFFAMPPPVPEQIPIPQRNTAVPPIVVGLVKSSIIPVEDRKQ
jgi:hypothetical protein